MNDTDCYDHDDIEYHYYSDDEDDIYDKYQDNDDKDDNGIFSRPRQIQGLLYKHRCCSLSHADAPSPKWLEMVLPVIK